MPPLSLSQLAQRELYSSFFFIAMFVYHASLNLVFLLSRKLALRKLRCVIFSICIHGSYCRPLQ